jgi:hypothetical protein
LCFTFHAFMLGVGGLRLHNNHPVTGVCSHIRVYPYPYGILGAVKVWRRTGFS